MTTNDLNKASDKELPKMLGEVLHLEDPCLCHTRYPLSRNASGDNNLFCTGCGGEVVPIDDWNIAMKWRDWAVEEYGEEMFLTAIHEVECQCLKTIAFAQPKHYEIAAASCKINSEAKR